MKQEQDGVQNGSLICTLAIWTSFFNLPLHWIPRWRNEKGLDVHLPSCEEAFRCSRRSQPNTFSLLPPFLRTLLIVPSCEMDPTRLDDDDTSSTEGISKVRCCRCFFLVCYRTWCCWRPVSGSFAALESLYSRLTASLVSSSALRNEQSLRRHKISYRLSKNKNRLLFFKSKDRVNAECSAPHFLLMCSLFFSLSKREAPPMPLHFSYLLRQTSESFTFVTPHTTTPWADGGGGAPRKVLFTTGPAQVPLCRAAALRPPFLAAAEVEYRWEKKNL